MSLFIKTILATAASGLIVSYAMAADGTINFTGEISAVTCSAAAGSGTTGGSSKDINVSLGKVSIDSLGKPGAEVAVGPNSRININLDCGATGVGLKTVKMQFDPNAGSGIDPKKNALLKTTGGATGVGIGIYDVNNKLLNMSANESIESNLVKTGAAGSEKYTADITLRAGYRLNGDPDAVGDANGTLPFSLTYQ